MPWASGCCQAAGGGVRRRCASGCGASIRTTASSTPERLPAPTTTAAVRPAGLDVPVGTEVRTAADFRNNSRNPHTWDLLVPKNVRMEQLQLAVTILGVLGGLFGLWYAGGQLRAAHQSARGTFLLELDEAFTRHTDVYIRLRPGDVSQSPGDWIGPGRGPENSSDWMAVEQYMGLFERIEVLIEGGVLDAQITNRLHGYRVRNIVANDRIRKTLLVDGAAGWQDFLSLIERLQGEGRVFAPLNPPAGG